MIGTENRMIINDDGKRENIKIHKNWFSTAVLRNLLEITC